MMTTRIYFSALRTADIHRDAIQKMLSRWNLGTLYSYRPTKYGVMKQTLLIRASSGNYVWKGNPLFPGQWKEEQYMMNQLSKLTDVPVPTPYLVDSADDIFGYSYALMPLLPGQHYHEIDKQSLTETEHIDILKKLVTALHTLHKWKTAIAGEYDTDIDTDLDLENDTDISQIQPFKKGLYSFHEQQMMYWLEDAAKFSVIQDADIAWVREVISSAETSFQNMSTYSFVMGDFKSENILLHQEAEEWQVSGIFDFTTAYFGDPLADVVKFTNQLIWNGQQKEAGIFLSTYLSSAEGAASRSDILSRLSVHFVYSLTLKWGEAHATGTVDHKEMTTFREYASRHLNNVLSLYKKPE